MAASSGKFDSWNRYQQCHDIYQELRLGSIILIIGTRTGIILMYDTYVDSLPARGLPAHVQPTTIASCLV